LDALGRDLRRAQEQDDFPFYGVLLYTRAPGADSNLRGLVNAYKEELDALTGANCLLYFIQNGGEVDIAQVYRVAEALGVSATALPCATFFSEPAVSRQVLRVRLNEFGLPLTYYSRDHLIRNFRSIADALGRSAGASDGERMETLRAELIREHERLRHVVPATARERLESAGATAGAASAVFAVGKNVASAVLALV
jgi:hypothetical protein